MWFIVTIQSLAWCGVEANYKVWAETEDEAVLIADPYAYDILTDYLDEDELDEDDFYTIDAVEYNQSVHGEIDYYEELK